MFGPTVGDKVRLADTELFVEVEEDRTTYGEEIKFGGGKVIRDGMGQAQTSRAQGAVDTVITNALISKGGHRHSRWTHLSASARAATPTRNPTWTSSSAPVLR